MTKAGRAAARHEQRVAGRVAGALQECARRQRAWHEPRPHEGELLGEKKAARARR